MSGENDDLSEGEHDLERVMRTRTGPVLDVSGGPGYTWGPYYTNWVQTASRDERCNPWLSDKEPSGVGRSIQQGNPAALFVCFATLSAMSCSSIPAPNSMTQTVYTARS